MKAFIDKDLCRYIDALSDLWPQHKNRALMQQALEEIVNHYYAWHEKYAPTQGAYSDGQNSLVLEKSLTLLRQLSAQLSQQSVPWPSPLYFAHMNTDTFLPAGLAYFTAMLYNPNNVTPEASPVTTALEYELSDAFCQLFGYNPQTAWAHLSSGGHASNYEAIWIARNLKRIPAAIKHIPPLAGLLAGINDNALVNLSVRKIAQWLKTAKTQHLLAQILAQITQPPCAGGNTGKILVAQGRHYAWDKCADLLGVELDLVGVNQAFRMDIDHLTQKIERYVTTGTPIVAVVATLGSSGEGSVDEIDKIIDLKNRIEEQYGCSFYIHVDAALGGYYRSLLVEPAGQAQPASEDLSVLLKPEVKRALWALQAVDSITVDPHKSGYIPYPAGCLAIRDRVYSSVISSKSRYFEQEEGMHMDFGPHTLEGARPGASVAAVWMSHRLLGFHKQGFGRLLAGNLLTANRLHQMLNADAAPGEQDSLCLKSLYPPDLNMLNFTVQPARGACSAARIDALNRRFSERIHLKNSQQKALLWLSKNIVTADKLLTENAEDNPPVTVMRCCVMKNVANGDLQAFLEQCRAHCAELSLP